MGSSVYLKSRPDIFPERSDEFYTSYEHIFEVIRNGKEEQCYGNDYKMWAVCLPGGASFPEIC